MESEKLLQASSLKCIEEAIAGRLSEMTEHQPDVEIRSFEVIKENALDHLSQRRYKIEMLVTVPRWVKIEGPDIPF